MRPRRRDAVDVAVRESTRCVNVQRRFRDGVVTRRPNPFTGARAANGSDWPRNGALLRGIPHEKDGKMYLEVNAIQQAGTEGFKDVRGQEKWMPDNGGSWNGGQWLHEPK